jgi:hypothetical protein
MLFWWLSVAALCASAFADGYTTQLGVKSGKLVEGNPVLDKLTGTDTPDPLQTYGVGFAIIAAEVLFGTLMIHHNTWGLGWFWPWGALIQTGFHIYASISNYKLDTGK